MACIFCRISAGEAAASFVYEDDRVFGIMSLDQPNAYKVLVIPREHVESVYDLSEEQAAGIFQAAVKVARAIRDASGCEGLNLVQSNGRAGQQDVFHFHMHLIPRFRGDSVEIRWDHVRPGRTELDQMAEQIRSNLR
jgi:histidine triad (HIT) family protein